MSNNSNSKSMSWGWIMFWFVVFIPVGIYFLIKKLTADIKNHKTVAIISYVFIGLGVLFFLSDEPNKYLFFVCLGGIGIWFRRISKKMKRKGEKYKKYTALVINQSQSSIDYIASAVGVTYENAVHDLQEMIDAGYLTNTYINKSSRMIVTAHGTPQSAVQTAAAQPQTKVIACSGCGANNTIIIGQINECEYCGSPLE